MQSLKYTKDRTIRLLISAYCVYFFSLRLILPHSLRNDEAEQVLAASSFELGYLKQPPLYSWLIYISSQIFNSGEINIFIIQSIKYLCYFSFLFLIYLLAKKIFKSKQTAYLCLLSQIFFVTYSYDFTRDLSHTILVSVFGVLSLIVYLKLWAKPNLTNYLKLGLVFGLGFMSKYNFLFIALPLVLASFTHPRASKILFNAKTLLSLLACTLISSPHIYYLYKKSFSGIEYALERSNAVTEKIYSLLELISKKLSTLAFTYYEVILVFLILSLIFLFFQNHSKKLTNSQVPNYNFKKFFLNFSLIASFIPALMIIVLGFNQFFAKWLSPIAFLYPLVFFIYFNPQIKNIQIKLIESLASIIIITISSVYIIGGFFPDLIGKISQTQYPYKDVCQQIQRIKNSPSKLTLITQFNEVLKANLKLTCNNSEIFYIREIKKSNPELLNRKDSIIIFTEEKKRENFIRRATEESFNIPDNLASIQSKYINSEKQFYKLYLIY